MNAPVYTQKPSSSFDEQRRIWHEINSQLGFLPRNPSIEWLEYTFNTSIFFVWEKKMFSKL